MFQEHTVFVNNMVKNYGIEFFAESAAKMNCLDVCNQVY